MSSADASARRAALKAELRREIDASSRLLVHTRSSNAKMNNNPMTVAAQSNSLREQPSAAVMNSSAGVAAALKESSNGTNGTAAESVTGRSASARRSSAFMSQFHSSSAAAAIRGAPATVEAPRSPRRGLGSPAARGRNGSPVPGRSMSLSGMVPTVESTSDAGSNAGRSDSVRICRAGPVARSSLEHHKGIVIPAEKNGTESLESSRLLSHKPLADGSRALPIKRQFPERRSGSPAPQSDAGSDAGGPPPAGSRRSDSPSGGCRRRIDRADNLSGCSATVSREQPTKVTGKMHTSRTNSPSRAPYFEHALDKPSGSPISAGLLGFGPTGKAAYAKPADHPRLLDEDTGVQGPEPVTRGVRLVEGKSHRTRDVLSSTNRNDPEPSAEEKFRPSVHVMHGPPPFVPPPPPQRTQSPRRTPRHADNDIFNTAPAPAAATTQSPLRMGRGMGRFSPLRTERPF